MSAFGPCQPCTSCVTQDEDQKSAPTAASEDVLCKRVSGLTPLGLNLPLEPCRWVAVAKPARKVDSSIRESTGKNSPTKKSIAKSAALMRFRKGQVTTAILVLSLQQAVLRPLCWRGQAEQPQNNSGCVITRHPGAEALPRWGIETANR